MIRRTRLYMDTLVDIQVVPGTGPSALEKAEKAVLEAFHAFRLVEDAVSRFTPDSELMQACKTTGTAVPVSPLVCAPLAMALTMAEQTLGLFDPAIGGRMEKKGFNKHYLTGTHMDSGGDCAEAATYRDIQLDGEAGTLLLRKPMVIDLGAVAKGFAIDLAANRLKGFPGFLINAGGDIYAGGADPDGEPWEIGIQHPLDRESTFTSIRLTDAAVCTSGGYERPSPITAGDHHILDPRTEHSPQHWLSASITAPYAMLADAFSTAALLLSPDAALQLVAGEGLSGLWIKPDLTIVRTGGI